MAFQEKRAWVMALASIGAYAAYLAAVLGGRGSGVLVDAPYVAALLWTVGAAIVANVVLQIPLALTAPRDAGTRDERDREINRFGEYVGQSFVVIGGVAALLMAMAEVEQFWIANAIYLAFVLSAVLSSGAKIAAYRWGFQPW
jgi:cation transporter-like permease